MSEGLPSFETLLVQNAGGVLEVAINRPEQLNAFNHAFWVDLKRCMEYASDDPEVRCVIVHGGSCRLFTAGLDLKSELMSSSGLLGVTTTDRDVSRKALKMDSSIRLPQEAISSLEHCVKPVIAAMHSGVVGGGVDLVSACDIRYCTEDTWLSIAEVDVGLTADIGTLQRLPKIVGNDSVVRELALTGRKLLAKEAKELGLVGKILPSKDACLEEARQVAKQIASKSPVAVLGTKVSLNFSRDHSVQEGLDHIRQWNSVHLMSDDVKTAATAMMSKSKPTFSKL
mmetsp:Transcript_96598/g.171761  ORF Transcript_96598/g.171761 Transcript_96598/m.171761 type:complete len:284 (+) Transcript_96598:48-899(+)|eukprot:CAMPEP_0197658462 /NCGR_PEP_ID=MMETSP1338-20131121/45256_1 /TAXON_ID=43686 ORGANISM="Pelagodinium beii, Strain RCC1491" /NCGR_SAMPLE_ID=MMETSP1338 /ASSEMBLY_ACC=CAM_ASM_000754 /LENGTH=283 /DNA_ID=CAMNT_0043235059 /DNA_START=38 /DNA_END=889 /DNA_ORIENTATION=+